MMTRQIVVYPVLFAIWIILGRYSQNQGEVELNDIMGSLVFVPLITFLCWVILGRILNDWNQSAFYVWLSLVYFFAYRHLYEVFRIQIPFIDHEIRSLLLIAVWGGLFLLGFLLRNCAAMATRILNIASIGLLTVSMLAIFMNSTEEAQGWTDTPSTVGQSPPHTPVFANNTVDRNMPPNIYYIVLDGYGRADVLEDLYGYRNDEFLEYLRGTGFNVLSESRANYAQTALSLASSLNLRYLHHLPEQLGRTYKSRKPLRSMIVRNRLMTFLKRQGYQNVSYSTGASLTELRDTDHYVTPQGVLNEWDIILLSQTPVPSFMKTVSGHSLFDIHKKRLTFMFAHVPSVIETDEPHFVFSHFLAPHPPFVFGDQTSAPGKDPIFSFLDGGSYRQHYDVSSQEYIRRYIKQLDAINQRVRIMIERILENSRRPPIIILQSDHGPGAFLDWEKMNKTSLKERMTILNAIYLPGGEQIGLYHDMTPVNTFRIILNHYFQTNYPLLNDESYFSTMNHPYDFVRVTDQVKLESQVSGP